MIEIFIVISLGMLAVCIHMNNRRISLNIALLINLMGLFSQIVNLMGLFSLIVNLMALFSQIPRTQT